MAQTLPFRPSIFLFTLGLSLIFFLNLPFSFSWLSSQVKYDLINLMAVAEDVETQQKGCVLVFYQSNPSIRVFSTRSLREETRQTLSVFPIRVCALHTCLPDNPAFSLVKAAVMASSTPEVRTRLRFHSGEWLYNNTVNRILLPHECQLHDGQRFHSDGSQ
jgi:hypothetical protein